jgi:hypothetical protein
MFWDFDDKDIVYNDPNALVSVQKFLDNSPMVETLKDEERLHFKQKWDGYFEMVIKADLLDGLKALFEHRYSDEYLFWKLCLPMDKIRNMFVLACETGKLEIAKFFYGTKCFASSAINKALELAIIFNHTNIIRYLIEELECPVEYWGGIFIAGATRGDLGLIKLILEKEPTRNLYNAYICAAENGHLDILKYFDDHVASQVEPDSRLERDEIEVMCTDAVSPAVKNNHAEVVRYLCDNKISSPFIKNDLGADLVTAIGCDSMEIAEYFISIGVDVKWNENAPLLNCAQKGNIQLFNKLCALGAFIPKYREKDYVSVAVSSGSVEMFELVRKSCSIDFLNKYKKLLKNLLQQGHLEMFKHISKIFEIEIHDIMSMAHTFIRNLYAKELQESTLTETVRVKILDWFFEEILVNDRHMYANKNMTNFLVEQATKRDLLDIFKWLARNNFCYIGKRSELLITAIKHKSKKIAKFLVDKILDLDDLIEAHSTIETVTTTKAENWHQKALDGLAVLISA